MLESATSGRPEQGQIVKCRTRAYLVEDVQPSAQGTRVRMACIDDDNQGAPLEVIWEHELDARVLDSEAWTRMGEKDFDAPHQFAAYYHTTRWNCVTATDQTLFQSPFRAGIRLDAYQLEPLRMALRLPKVNLFIADDVGLGKTIEAGLIARELLLRRRVSNIVICAPPGVLEQWREEMEQRFGLTFEIYNREYVRRIREERGFAINPWETHPRFLVSEKLLIDDAYSKPLIDWLENNPGGAPSTLSGDKAVDIKLGTLFIFDEAHHAAPATGSKYARDTKITAAIRNIAPRFEHRLFLSATPHNGHSNSYSALLNILDDTRFTPGIRTLKEQVQDVVVRRLKEDLRLIGHAFPLRNVKRIEIKAATDAPELILPAMLEEYRQIYRLRYASASKTRQQQAMIVFSTLRQRLFSSLPAFARTLAAHRRGMELLWKGETIRAIRSDVLRQHLRGPDSDDDEAELEQEQLEAAQSAWMQRASAVSSEGQTSATQGSAERKLLDQMRVLVERHQYKPDGRIQALLQWLRTECCPKIGEPEEDRKGAYWTNRRVIIFTEWDETLNYIRQQLQEHISGTHLAEERLEIYRGSTSSKDRARIKQAFNAAPREHPVRILLATDAAREGLNLQAHCHHLFHFDVPWNPGRLEQRNGRIDRKLQPAKEVHCFYFTYPQRKLDRVLEVLIEKTRKIHGELGSVGKVLDSKLSTLVEDAMSGDESALDSAIQQMESIQVSESERADSEEELESTRKRSNELRDQVNSLERHLEKSRKHLGLDSTVLRHTINSALDLLQERRLQPVESPDGRPTFALPALEAQPGKGSWAETMDTLRLPPRDGERDHKWRSQAPIRPLVFDAPEELDDSRVHAHLEHRIVRRLLGRFLAQGFIHNDLSRTCLAASRDEHTRVVLLGRVALYGQGAARLHEEIISVSARWSDPASRTRLAIEGVDASKETTQWLQDSLSKAASEQEVVTLHAQIRNKYFRAIGKDVHELRGHLFEVGKQAAEAAERALAQRAKSESDLMARTLKHTRDRILKKQSDLPALMQTFTEAERDQQRTLELNKRYWQNWLKNVDEDIDREPRRIREFYRTASRRIEPLGIVYLIGERDRRTL